MCVFDARQATACLARTFGFEGHGALSRRFPRRTRRGFSLLELLIGATVLTVVCVSTLAVLWQSRVQSRKAMEQDIMLDFAQHYLEIARAQQFDLIQPGSPINALYDGTHSILLPDNTQSVVDVRFPQNGTVWESLWTDSFRNFHPDLEWFASRQPEYRCLIDTQLVSGLPRARKISLELRWRPPLGHGSAWLTLSMDTVVYPEFG